MTMFVIENTLMGIVLGFYRAETEAEALDKMAQDAGYKNYAEALHEVPTEPGEIVITAA